MAELFSRGQPYPPGAASSVPWPQEGGVLAAREAHRPRPVRCRKQTLCGRPNPRSNPLFPARYREPDHAANAAHLAPWISVCSCHNAFGHSSCTNVKIRFLPPALARTWSYREQTSVDHARRSLQIASLHANHAGPWSACNARSQVIGSMSATCHTATSAWPLTHHPWPSGPRWEALLRILHGNPPFNVRVEPRQASTQTLPAT